MMTEKTVPSIYQYQYYKQLSEIEEHHQWCQGMRTVMDALLKEPAAQLGPLEILDVGCGAGYLIQYLSSNYNCKGTPTGLDVSKHALEFCREKGLSQLLLASASHIPVSDRAYDLVTCIDTLQHLTVDEESQTLKELARVIRTDGLLFLRTNSATAHAPGLVSSSRYRRYRINDLSCKLETVGFSVMHASYVNAIGAVAGMLKEFAGKPQGCQHQHADSDQVDHREDCPGGEHTSHVHENNVGHDDQSSEDMGPGLAINQSEIGKFRTVVVGLALQVEAKLIRAKLRIPFGHSMVLLARRR